MPRRRFCIASSLHLQVKFLSQNVKKVADLPSLGLHKPLKVHHLGHTLGFHRHLPPFCTRINEAKAALHGRAGLPKMQAWGRICLGCQSATELLR